MFPNEKELIDWLIKEIGEEKDRRLYEIALEKLGSSSLCSAYEIIEKEMPYAYREDKNKYFLDILKGKASWRGFLLFKENEINI